LRIATRQPRASVHPIDHGRDVRADCHAACALLASGERAPPLRPRPEPLGVGGVCERGVCEQGVRAGRVRAGRASRACASGACVSGSAC